MPVAEFIVQIMHYINNLAIGDPRSSASRFPCIASRNSPAVLSQRDFPAKYRRQRIDLRAEAQRRQKRELNRIWQAFSQPVVTPPGQGILPPEPQRDMPPSALGTTLLAVTQLSLAHGEKIYAALTASSRPATPSSDNSALATARYSMRAGEWVTAAITRSPALLTSTAVPQATADNSTYYIHYRNQNRLLFRKQLNAFFAGINWQPDQQQLQRLVANLYHQDVIFCLPDIHRRHRPTRAHVDEMKRRNLLYEMSIKDNTLATDGVGASIIAWADQQTETGYMLFMQGLETYNPLYFLASGGEIVLGHFAHTVGEIWQGTILDRQPGESRADAALRLSLNVALTPDGAAAKAFGIRAMKPVNTGRLKPVAKPKGSVLSHASSGITLESILESEISGQSWHLYPLTESRALAGRSGAQQTTLEATRSQHNLWRIEGVEGEHRFTHGKSTRWYVQSGEHYYPATFSVEEGTAQLQDGQVIYFHSSSQQWRVLFSGNAHLHSRVLALLPDGISSAQLGEQRVLASSGHQQCEVWTATDNGEQYLKVKLQAASGSEAETRWVAGRLEGSFFSIEADHGQPVYRQTVLQWQAESRQWISADSPFSALENARHSIDSSWLQQVDKALTQLVAIHNRPGLYRRGKAYYLRWYCDAQGINRFLPVEPTSDASQYRTPQPGAEAENYFRYDAANRQWQFLPFTSRAFFALPAAVKVQFTPALVSDSALMRYRHLFFKGDEVYIHTGADQQGRAEYIRVVQDRDDADLFSLRVPAANQPDSLWIFRYDEDDEFVLQEQRPCLPRSRRAGDEPCAGPSGIGRPQAAQSLQPLPKRLRTELMSDAEALAWLETQPRLPQERLNAQDTGATTERKNLTYALRLNTGSPGEISLSRIASYAGVTVRRLNFLLSNLTPECSYILLSHPPKPDESDLLYALRLHRQHTQLNPRILAWFIGLKEGAILRRAVSYPLEEQKWLELHPRYQLESQLQYALRLARLPGSEEKIAAIANHAKVPEPMLRSILQQSQRSGQDWLQSMTRQESENAMDFAVRLFQQPHEHVTLQMIANHAGLDKQALLQRLDERWNYQLPKDLTGQWLSNYPRQQGEKSFDYASRLVSLREQQIGEGRLAYKLITNSAIALHAGISNNALSTGLSGIKSARQWCSNHPRLAAEALTEGESAASKSLKNKLYTLRLLKVRNEQASKKVKYSVLAAHVGISESELKSWVFTTRKEWLNSIPRLSNEISYENSDELTIQRNNQRYARRLAGRREAEKMAWLVSDKNLAQHAEVTPLSFRMAMDPLFGITDIKPAPVVNVESVWQPEQGLLHLQLKQNPPLLVDAKNPLRSVTKEVVTGPVTITNLHNIVKRLPKAERQAVAERFLTEAQDLVDSDGSRQDYFVDEQGNQQPGLLSHKLQIYHNEQAPELGMQIIAKEAFEPYELIGVYTGSWHPDAESLRSECRKMGSQPVYTYLWGVYKGDASVSAYQNANKLALINCAELTVESSASAQKPHNNVAAMYINGCLPLYYTTEKIAKGEQLLISYGDYYIADYKIQSGLNHDIVRIIAREEQCYFIVQGLDGSNMATFGPDGAINEVPQHIEAYILKERLDKRGILRYDALGRKGVRRIAISKDDADNLYHAMAKAIRPQGGRDIIEQQIIFMKNAVASEYAGEEKMIKPELDDAAER